LEGELPAKFMAQMDRQGVALMPTYEELSFDCDCGDYAMPCAHVATVFQVLSQALDGDPFLLLTLRGRTRDHLLSNLRSHWGDDRAIRTITHAIEEPAPAGDWWSSADSVPDFACSFTEEVQDAAGLRALGPPPGESGLVGALAPLYSYGGGVSREFVAGLPDREPVKARRVAAATKTHEPAPTEERTTTTQDAPLLPSKKNVRNRASSQSTKTTQVEAPVVDLTEVMVDTLAAMDSATSKMLARKMKLNVSVIRQELIELEGLGLVFQDRSGREPVWRLG
jgi:ribosomal protein S25